MILWDGTCEVHDILSTESVLKMKSENPEAKVIAHPECKAQILEIADFVGSTAQMLNFTKKDETKKYIVATETGIVHQMKRESPEKTFLIVPSNQTCSCNDCPYMKMNTLEKIYLCLKNEKPEIFLNEDEIESAKIPVQRMIEISKVHGLIG